MGLIIFRQIFQLCLLLTVHTHHPLFLLLFLGRISQWLFFVIVPLLVYRTHPRLLFPIQQRMSRPAPLLPHRFEVPCSIFATVSRIVML